MLSLIHDKAEVKKRRSKKFKAEDSDEPQINSNVEARDDTQRIEEEKNNAWLKDVLSRFREDRNSRNYLRVCLVFLIQNCLLFCIGYSIINEPNLPGALPFEDSDENFPFCLLVIKLFCSIILHVEMQPKVGDSIERLFYLRNHPHKFDNIEMPYLICVMKLMVEFSIELICLCITSYYNTPVEVMMNYIALGCITNLDEVYYGTIRSPLKVQIEEAEFELPIDNHEHISYWKDLSCSRRFLLRILKPLEFLYHTLYFHMFHYIIFVFLFMRKGFGDFVDN